MLHPLHYLGAELGDTVCVCACMCGYCTGSKFYQSSPNNVVLLENAEGAKLPLTHPSDF